MAGAVDISERLSAIAQYLRDADHPLAPWFAESLALARTGVGLEQALGLSHGFEAVWQRCAQEEALRAIAASVGPAPSVSALARLIADRLKRYRQAAWARDKRVGRRPQGESAFCFDYLQARGAPSYERLRRLPLLFSLVTESVSLTSKSMV